MFANQKKEDKEMLEIRFLKEHIRMLRILGLWQKGSTGWRRRLSRLFIRVLLAEAVYRILVLRLIDIYYNFSEPVYVCESVVFIALPLQLLAKSLTHLLQADKIERIVDDLEMLERYNDEDDDVQRRLLGKTKRVFDGLVRYGSVAFVMAASTFTALSVPDFIKIRTMPVRGWYPYDADVSPNFELSLFQHSLGEILAFPVMFVSDLFLLVVLVYAIMRLKILNHEIRHIRNHAERSVQRRAGKPAVVRRIKKLVKLDYRYFINKLKIIHRYLKRRWRKFINRNKVTDTKAVCVDSNISTEKIKSSLNKHIANEINIPGSFIEALTNSTPKMSLRKKITESKHNKESELLNAYLRRVEPQKNDDEVNLEMERRLRICVNHHSDLLRFLRDIEATYSPMFLVQILCNLVPVGCIILYTTLIPKIDIKCISMIILLVGAILELFIFCLLITIVSDESSQTREALFECDWLRASEKFKKSMRIMMSRANQPFVVNAAGFVPMTMETFDAITKKSISYYVVMSKVAAPYAAHYNPSLRPR